MSNFREKYLKYKAKYLALRNQRGSGMIRVIIQRGYKKVVYYVDSAMPISDLKQRFANDVALRKPSVEQYILYKEWKDEHGRWSRLNDKDTLDQSEIGDDDIIILHPSQPLNDEDYEKIRINLIHYRDNGYPILLEDILNDHIGELNFMTHYNLNQEEVLIIIKALNNNKTISSLILDGSEVNIKGAESIAELLYQNRTIANLGLANTGLQNESINKIANAIANIKTLVKLNLNSNSIGDEGAGRLARALKHNISIEEVSIAGNKFGEVGRKALEAVVAARPELRIQF